MLRPTISRKVVRLRSARALQQRNYYNPLNPFIAGRDGPAVTPPPVPLYTKPIDPEEIRRQIAEAERADLANMKTRLTERAEIDGPEMDEAALKAFYTALVASGPNMTTEELLQLAAPPRPDRMSPEERLRVLSGLEARLPIAHEQVGESSTSVVQSEGNVVKRVLQRLGRIRLPGGIGTTSFKGKERDLDSVELPSGLVMLKEWDALFYSQLDAKNARGAESILRLMMQHGYRPNEELALRVMEMDALAGRSHDVARVTGDLVSSGIELSPDHQNNFILSLMNASPPQPQNAIAYLREAELASKPLSQESYNIVLSRLTEPSLTFQPTSHTRALAWDLFTHMRLMAHPKPTKAVYSTMIRTCADPREPQPERARDLWIEMTETDELQPERAEYDAIIRALGSVKGKYLEAYELLRQMLSKHHDCTVKPFQDIPSTLWSPFVPTLDTFSALLEGTKRAGDIERARWALTELLGLSRSSVQLGGRILDGPDEEFMSSIFMTYAAWKPTIKAHQLKRKPEFDAAQVEGEGGTAVVPNTDTSVAAAEDRQSDAGVPRSAEDALREATALFDRVLYDVSSGNRNPLLHPFTNLKLNPRLVNSYLSVYLAHARPAVAREVWDETWAKVREVRPNVVPNGWSYMSLLERCCLPRRAGETREQRQEILQWGQDAWPAYLAWYAKASPTLSPAWSSLEGMSFPALKALQEDISVSRRARWLAGLGDRQIERCWKAIIRNNALAEDLDGALAKVKEFREQFPAKAIYDTYAPLRPNELGMRHTDMTALAEPDIPPNLLFEDVDILHERLLRREDKTGLRELSFTIKLYTKAIMRRRSWRRRGKDVPHEVKRAKAEKEQLGIVRAELKAQLDQGGMWTEIDDLPGPGEYEGGVLMTDDLKATRRGAWGLPRASGLERPKPWSDRKGPAHEQQRTSHRT